MLFDHIAAEARTIVNAKYSGDTANDAADCAADNGAHRAGSAFTFGSTSFDAPGNTLGLSNGRKRHHGNDSGSSKKTADHDDLHFAIAHIAAIQVRR